MWCDSHCHISYEGVGPDAIAKARARDVMRMVTIGTDQSHSRSAIALAQAADGVWATVGVHPHDAVHGLEGIDELLSDPANDGAVVAVGECGLDYFYDHSPRDVQREVFAAQVRLAAEHELPVVVHTRDAWDDTFDILRSEGVAQGWVLHCFTGGPDEARRALDLGAYVSFSGIVTFRKAAEVREAAALCPLDRVLVETDSPYLTPEPYRGRTNSPALVPFVGAGVAEARGVDVQVIEKATWDNAAAAFGLT